MKRPIGTIVSARPELQAGRLKVLVAVKMETGEVLEAQMPDREVSAILPRSILLGGTTRAPLSLLDTVRPILERMSEGRRARLWLYKERWFLSFQPWRGVRFENDQPPLAQDRAAEAASATVIAPPA
jgi:hypothetical protein